MSINCVLTIDGERAPEAASFEVLPRAGEIVFVKADADVEMFRVKEVLHFAAGDDKMLRDHPTVELHVSRQVAPFADAG